jgi:hypothetical protein
MIWFSHLIQVAKSDRSITSSTKVSYLREKGLHTLIEVAGDAMVRELDMSQITLRLLESVNKQGQGSEDHTIAKLTGPTLSTLQRALVCANYILES